jgi:hypothetical protein
MDEEFSGWCGFLSSKMEDEYDRTVIQQTTIDGMYKTPLFVTVSTLMIKVLASYSVAYFSPRGMFL